MAYFLYGLFFVSCLVLIGAVLLQPGKTDAGALFTSNISSTSYTPRGAQTVLSKATIIAATIFMLSALLLSMPALTGNISVLQTAGEDPSESAPSVAADANTNANSAQSNVDAVPEANSAAEPPGSPANEGTNPDAKNSEEKGVEKPAEQPAKQEK